MDKKSWIRIAIEIIVVLIALSSLIVSIISCLTNSEANEESIQIAKEANNYSRQAIEIANRSLKFQQEMEANNTAQLQKSISISEEELKLSICEEADLRLKKAYSNLIEQKIWNLSCVVKNEIAYNIAEDWRMEGMCNKSIKVLEDHFKYKRGGGGTSTNKPLVYFPPKLPPINEGEEPIPEVIKEYEEFVVSRTHKEIKLIIVIALLIIVLVIVMWIVLKQKEN
jgi:flagellar basal body-associated protein FliL